MALTKILEEGIKDGEIVNADINASAAIATSKITGLATSATTDTTNASNIASGTLPDARFPATLPAASAANLTAIPAANITGTLPAISGANLTGINTDLVSDTSPQLGGNLDTNSFEILLDDSHAVKFGDGHDMQIYHDGTNNILNSDNGEIRLMNGSEYMFRAVPNGSNRLYYDNSTKAETLSTGFMVNGHLDLVDNNKARFGTGNDLQIYHDGSHSYIQDSGTGDLTLIANKTVIGSSNNAETCATFEENASVKLYYDNNLRFETHSNGSSLRASSPSSAATHWSEGGFKPWANDTYDLGDASYRWRNIHCNDGIMFKGNNTNATTLDDYEEGTWTPVIGSGSTTNIYSPRYTKIGNLCTISFSAYGFSDNSSSTAFYFTGLPFTSDSQGGAGLSVGACFTAKFSVESNIISYVGASTTTIRFYDHGTGDYDAVRHNNINGTNTTHRIFTTITYTTA